MAVPNFINPKVDNQDEYIISAAIWWKDMPTSHLLPTNIDKGVVIGGHRHGDCVYTMNAITGTRQCEQGEQEQGFLTSKNRFLDRVEAMKLALKTGQTNDRSKEGDHLFSEDLY